MPDTVTVKSKEYDLLAEYFERSWGKGVKVSFFEVGVVGTMCPLTIRFACHPEFCDFDRYQGMSPEQLKDEAAKRIFCMELSGELGRIFEMDATPLFRFNE